MHDAQYCSFAMQNSWSTGHNWLQRSIYPYVCMCVCVCVCVCIYIYIYIYIYIHRASDCFQISWAQWPVAMQMMGNFSKGWVNDNLKCTHLNHSLYLLKTLLTKSAFAGFQLWVSSLAAFCLANRRFSLLPDKEVDVRWLVLVLGCQLITCSDARQGSRSSPSTVSYVLHMQRCCCLVPFSVLRL